MDFNVAFLWTIVQSNSGIRPYPWRFLQPVLVGRFFSFICDSKFDSKNHTLVLTPSQLFNVVGYVGMIIIVKNGFGNPTHALSDSTNEFINLWM